MHMVLNVLHDSVLKEMFVHVKPLCFFFYSQVYRQDCETFGMVVKMLVAKDPNLEKQLQVPLRENLGEIRERCLEDLKHFISELDEAVRQPEPSVCDSTTPSTALTGHKLSKTGVNHSSSYWHTGLICSVWDRMARLTAEHNGYLGIHFGLLDWTDSTARQPEERHWKNTVLHCIWGWTVLVLNRPFLPLSSLLKNVILFQKLPISHHYENGRHGFHMLLGIESSSMITLWQKKSQIRHCLFCTIFL